MAQGLCVLRLLDDRSADLDGLQPSLQLPCKAINDGAHLDLFSSRLSTWSEVIGIGCWPTSNCNVMTSQVFSDRLMYHADMQDKVGDIKDALE